MKALLYKEFKLAMHPICYVFLFLFPFMTLIPNYPLGIGFIYLLSCYPILFLGANKGQQSNDLLYSTLLPVRKKDIVLARIITVIIMQFVYIIIMSALIPLALFIRSKTGMDTPGISLDGYVSLLAIVLVGFAICDLIFFPIYYRNGKSIVLSTLMTILGFVIYLLVFTILLPLVFDWYKNTLETHLAIQFAFLGGGLVISTLIHFLVYKISSKKLENVDF